MGLTYTGNTADRVDCGTFVDDMATLTYWFWGQHTSDGNFRRMLNKGNDIKDWILQGTGPDVNQQKFRQNYTTTNCIRTGTRTIPANEPVFLAVTFDESSGVAKLFNGTLTTLITEDTGATGTNGSGTASSDAANNFLIGARWKTPTPDRSWGGVIYCAGVLDVVATEAQLQDLQFNPRVTNDTIGFWVLGHYGTSSVPDLSGNAHTGTATGLTAADHMPARPLFGIDSDWSGVVTVSGTTTGVGSSAGTSTVTATGESTFAGAGSSAGVGAASATGQSTAAATASSAGVGAASGSSVTVKTGDGSASGTGAASATGQSTVSQPGSISGTSTATAVGQSKATSTASSSGLGTASAVGLDAAAGPTGGGIIERRRRRM